MGHRNEVWSFDINPSETRLISGSSDHELRVWSLKRPDSDSGGAAAANDEDGKQDEESRKVRKLTSGSSPSSSSLLYSAEEAAANDIATFYGILKRTGSGGAGGVPSQRVAQIRFNARGTLLAVAGAEKLLEMFSVRTAEEVKRKVARRVRRAREKREKAEKKKGGKKEEKMEQSDSEEDDETDEAKLSQVTPSVQNFVLLISSTVCLFSSWANLLL